MDYFINTDFFNCDNANKNIISCTTQIGFTTLRYHKIIFIVLSIIGLVFSFVVFIDYLREKCERRKRKKSSMKRIFKVLRILDFLSSLYWLLSSTIFYNILNIKENKPYASILSLLYIFLLIFTLCFINCMLTHFRKMNFDPFESIIKSSKSFIQYLIRCTLFSSFISILSFFLGILGKSPMNTCFINTELTKRSAFVYIIIFLLIIFAIYKIIHGLYFSKMFINKDKERELYVQNSIYALIYCCLHIPMLILFLITFFRGKNIVENDIFLPEFSYFCTVLLFFSPLINNCLSFYQGMLRLKCLEKFKRKENNSLDISRIFSNDLTLSLTVNDQYDWLEKHAIEFFMRNILLGIATSIKKSKKIPVPLNPKFDKNDFVDSIKYEINFANFELNDDETKNSEYLDIKVIEYAPKCFKYLRELEKINIDYMIKSLLPQNNKMGMKKSAGKSGSFFISTDNGEFMIKTLKPDEFEIIRNAFLEKYIEYMRQNPNSLICRIYGIYNLIQYNGTDFYVIVMRNVIGPFKENIVAKFDLKGSTTNRKVKDLNLSKIDNDVMKDLNFNDIEFGLMLNNKNIAYIRKITTNDSQFLADLGLMDYSLFVVKLSLNKKQAADIFGEDIQERQEKDYLDIINDKTLMNAYTNRFNSISDNSIKRIKLNELNSKYKHYLTYLFPGLNVGTAYIISIIDYLQDFNFYKLMEYEYKTKFTKEKTDIEGGISCVHPKLYSERFINYVNNLTQVKHILTDKKDKK